jgi:hypothetical protein
MKKYLSYIILLLLITACCAGCKKDIPVSNSLIGTWELREDINGLSGKPTYHKKGNDSLIVFTPSNYELRENGKTVNSGTYVVKRDSFHVWNTIKDRIIWDNETDTFRTFFEINNNQLSIMIDANDAPSVIYQRIK